MARTRTRDLSFDTEFVESGSNGMVTYINSDDDNKMNYQGVYENSEENWSGLFS